MKTIKEVLEFCEKFTYHNHYNIETDIKFNGVGDYGIAVF